MAEMVAEAFVPTGMEVTVNVAVVAFAATVTLGGTVAAAVLALDRETTAPPAGAGPVKITVAVEGVPPMTDVGFKLRLVRLGAVTVKVAVFVAL